MAFDYPFVYSPMARMITPPGQARTAEFRQLHVWSETVNGVQIGCVLGAALIMCGTDGTVPQRNSQNVR